MNECAFEKTSDPSLQGIKPDDWAAQSLMFCPVVCVFFFFCGSLRATERMEDKQQDRE